MVGAFMLLKDLFSFPTRCIRIHDVLHLPLVAQGKN